MRKGQVAGAGTLRTNPPQQGFQPGPRSLPAPTPVLGRHKEQVWRGPSTGPHALKCSQPVAGPSRPTR